MADKVHCPKCKKVFFHPIKEIVPIIGNWFTPESLDEAVQALQKGILCPFCHILMKVSGDYREKP